MLLPRHSFAQPIYSESGSMVYCKLKNKATASHRWVASSPGHFNTDRSNSVAELDPVSFTSTHCYRQSFRGILVTTTARQILPSRPTGGWENRLKGIVESIVLSGGVTCRQKCPDYSSPRYFQLSGTCLWLMKEGTVRQSLCPWAGARVFHVDVVHGWQFGNLCGFAAAVVDAAGAGRALSFLSDQSIERSVRV